MGAWFLHSACWVEWFALLPTFSYTNVAKDDWTSLTDCVKWTYQQLFVVNFMPWEIVVKKEISGVSQNVSLQNKRNWFLARHLILLESRKMKELQKTDDGLATPRFVKGKYFYIEECNTAVKTLWIGEITCFTFRIIWNMTIYFVYLSQPKATQINWKSFAWRNSGVNEVIRKLNQGKIAGWISKLTTISAQC